MVWVSSDPYNPSDFTVLLAFYAGDDAALLRRALRSITGNTAQPACTVIVQDGPVSDELSEVVQDFYKCNTTLHVRLAENQGLSHALNEGLKYIETEYVIRADADDINLPNRFETLIDHLADGYDLVGSSILEVEPSGNAIARRVPPLSAVEIRGRMPYRNPFNHMSVGFRTEVINAVGGYPHIILREDYALWATLVSNAARVKNLPEVLVHATTGEDMYKRRGGLRYAKGEIQLQSLLVRLELQNRYLGYLVGLARALVFLMPGVLRGLIYESLLRRRIDARSVR